MDVTGGIYGETGKKIQVLYTIYYTTHEMKSIYKNCQTKHKDTDCTHTHTHTHTHIYC